MSQATAASVAKTHPESPWTPLRQRLFRMLWIATLVSNIGTWMHDVGAAWLMTSLAPSPIMVSMVQAAITLPIFVFALPAGVLADIVDRRRMLLLAQFWMLLAATSLGLLQLSGLVTPWLVLVLTFALGLGAALNAPSWQAIVPELVSKEDLPAAIALNSLGINIARAVGPALGGVVVAASGPGAVFILNGLSVLGVLVVLYRWQREPRPGSLPPERYFGALRAGFRYVHQSPALQTVLLRSGAFFLFASAPWALLPLVARRELGVGAGGYGSLLGFIGGGAVFGALMLPRLRSRIGANRLTAFATVVFALAAAALATVRDFPVLCAVMVVAGFAWIAMLSTLNVAAQMALPRWVKARALAVTIVVFNGAMAAGSAAWGAIATKFGIPVALVVAAGGQILALLLVYRRRFPDELSDLTPSLHWPAPTVAENPELDRGPVLVTVEYYVEAARSLDFVRAMDAMRRLRRRDGAISWRLFEDAARPGRWLELFELASWVEHLRQHERVTEADRLVQQGVQAFHVGDSPPLVSHLLAPSRLS